MKVRPPAAALCVARIALCGITRLGICVATTSTPWLPSKNSSREQPHVMSMPGAAPKPRNRSIRIAPSADSRLASRATWRRCGSAGPKILAASSAGVARAEHGGAGGIGPQDAHAVGRPQPGRQGAFRVRRQPRIAFDLPQKFRPVHRLDLDRAGFVLARPRPGKINGSLVSPARAWQVHGPAARVPSKAEITLIPVNPSGAVGVERSGRHGEVLANGREQVHDRGTGAVP